MYKGSPFITWASKEGRIGPNKSILWLNILLKCCHNLQLSCFLKIYAYVDLSLALFIKIQTMPLVEIFDWVAN
jgi:hypothetical protein